LQPTNNASERELRRIAVGRHAWLFVGSDDHAQAAGHLFSLVASARLHHLDPELYLRDVLRVLPHWPRDRYLELAPKYWAATRAPPAPIARARGPGPLTVPPKPPPPKQQDPPQPCPLRFSVRHAANLAPPALRRKTALHAAATPASARSSTGGWCCT